MTETYQRRNLSIDQQLALKTAAAHLAEESSNTFAGETIDRFLHSSYDQFAQHATIPGPEHGPPKPPATC